MQNISKFYVNLFEFKKLNGFLQKPHSVNGATWYVFVSNFPKKKKKKMNEEYNFCDISYWQRESNVLLNKNNSVYYIWNIHMKKKKMTSKCSQMDVKNFSFYYYM